MPSIKWMAPEGRPKIFPIYKKVTSLGRAPASDVAIDSRELADHHAQIVFDGRDFAVSETSDDALLHINGKKKRRAKIFHGDRLQIGSVDLQFLVLDEGVLPTHDTGEAEAGVSERAGMHKLAEFSGRLSRVAKVEAQLELLVDAVIDATNAAKGFVILLRDGQPQVTVARNVTKESLPDDVTQLSDSILRRVIET